MLVLSAPATSQLRIATACTSHRPGLLQPLSESLADSAHFIRRDKGYQRQSFRRAFAFMTLLSSSA
jgi:hypothetical protein